MEEWKGWTKIADLDTSNGGDCPKEWKIIMVNGIKVCRAPSDAAGCYSTFFSVNGGNKLSEDSWCSERIAENIY